MPHPTLTALIDGSKEANLARSDRAKPHSGSLMRFSRPAERRASCGFLTHNTQFHLECWQDCKPARRKTKNPEDQQDSQGP